MIDEQMNAEEIEATGLSARLNELLSSIEPKNIHTSQKVREDIEELKSRIPNKKQLSPNVEESKAE